VVAYCWLRAPEDCVEEPDVCETSETCGGAYLPQLSHDGRNWLEALEVVKD